MKIRIIKTIHAQKAIKVTIFNHRVYFLGTGVVTARSHVHYILTK
ncbi:hypothetical protein [Winogradskyella sp.]|nr:hypothetical protein [Winogradskyella sp.]